MVAEARFLGARRLQRLHHILTLKGLNVQIVMLINRVVIVKIFHQEMVYVV